MMHSHGQTQNVIRAAGGILWRPTSAGYDVAIIHRRRYNDWTLPKGKLNDGESWRDGALREVREETGYSASILGFAGAIAYTIDQCPKIVRFWHMLALGEPVQHIDSEVAEVIWLPVAEAVNRIQYPLEQALLEECSSPEADSVPFAR